MADTETLDDLVRRVDPDRWQASRFIGDPVARADVIALYALNYELARVAGGVSNALMGEIRLTWWREAMEEVAAGKAPRKHPNVEALAASRFDPNALAALADARFTDLDEGPLKDEAAVMAYVDGTAGALAVLAALWLSLRMMTLETRLMVAQEIAEMNARSVGSDPAGGPGQRRIRGRYRFLLLVPSLVLMLGSSALLYLNSSTDCNFTDQGIDSDSDGDS